MCVISFHKKGRIPTCQMAKNRRTSCMRHQRHRAPHFTPTGGVLWAVATHVVAFRGLPAAKELPQRGSLLKGAVLSSAVSCFLSHAPLPGTQPPFIRRRRLVSTASVATLPTLSAGSGRCHKLAAFYEAGSYGLPPEQQSFAQKAKRSRTRILERSRRRRCPVMQTVQFAFKGFTLQIPGEILLFLLVKLLQHYML